MTKQRVTWVGQGHFKTRCTERGDLLELERGTIINEREEVVAVLSIGTCRCPRVFIGHIEAVTGRSLDEIGQRVGG
jgi:hypothetical protein